MKIFFTILLLSICCYPQHYIALKFSEQMDTQTLIIKENYAVFDNQMQEIEIIEVGLHKDTDSIAILVIPYFNYKTTISIRVDNVKDKAGNQIAGNNSTWFYFEGIDPVKGVKWQSVEKEKQ